MDQGAEWRESDTFVVRVFRSVGSGLTGLVQHVRTGEKVPFQGLESLGAAMARMALPPGRQQARPEGARTGNEDSADDAQSQGDRDSRRMP